jgi:hypothetical protein
VELSLVKKPTRPTLTTRSINFCVGLSAHTGTTIFFGQRIQMEHAHGLCERWLTVSESGLMKPLRHRGR